MPESQPQMTWEQAVQWARETASMSGLVEVCYYDDPATMAALRFEASEEWLAIKDLLRLSGGERVLEIGAGRGLLSWCFARAGCQVTALEPNDGPLVGTTAIHRLCEETGQKIDIVSEHSSHLSFEGGKFDIVICRGVLHHVEDLDTMVSEVFRVLRPGGRFLALKEHAADTPEELMAFLEAHPLHHLYGGEHAWPVKAYRSAFNSAGFRLREFGHFDHAVSSAPHVTSGAIQNQAQNALAKRLTSPVATALVKIPFVTQLYRRWLTFRCRIPGRLHSFLAVKAG